ncbi:PREDICTED: uncharacterized protein LOC105359277 [Ceratosolen solmsi marchali]|uniref:Uncharacterized protein LOC105359277 n=1 Tax=Ceratosolen solmsi marchali TaxID=326594 RepID=A0AAJ6VJF5_9HYME|nr:PREDICTED: uncharacterized protein LOC105359277 [Ceratosolen solmsi marchali]
MNIDKSVIKKIPGEIIPLPKKSSQGYIDDLQKKQKFELLELLERQEKLANKSFISKLPDKGEKILNFKHKIMQEIEHRNKVEDAAKLLSRLNIATEGKAAMDELEWTGKYTEKPIRYEQKIVELDSDDEDDALKILAQPTGSGTHKKKIIHIGPEENLIKPEDLEDIDSFKTLNSLKSEHVNFILNKVECSDHENKKEPFKPYKTTKTNVHDPDKEKQRENKKKAHWEITAATPPLIVHGAIKTLNLNESLMLQKEQALKLQNIQAKNAVERLTQHIGMYKVGDLSGRAGNYRIQNTKDFNSSSSEDEESYPEVHDDEDNDKGGTVLFTVDTIES